MKEPDTCLRRGHNCFLRKVEKAIKQAMSAFEEKNNYYKEETLDFGTSERKRSVCLGAGRELRRITDGGFVDVHQSRPVTVCQGVRA